MLSKMILQGLTAALLVAAVGAIWQMVHQEASIPIMQALLGRFGGQP